MAESENSIMTEVKAEMEEGIEEMVPEQHFPEEEAGKEESEKNLTGETFTGTVRWFSPRRGYGFITQDGTDKDYYVHFSGICGTGYRKLVSGEAVEFEVGIDQKNRPIATNVVQLTGFTAIDDAKDGR